MSASSCPVMAGDAAVSFTVLEGIVVGTDQRSDSYTSGSGRTLVIDGTGGGSSSVSTEVVVSRDIWIKDRGGQEHHVRISADVPVRAGQEVAFINGRGEVAARPPRPAHSGGGLLAVYVLPTNTSYPVLPLQDLAGMLAAPPASTARKVGTAAAWLISLLLVPVFAIGIVLLVFLTIRAAMAAKRRRARQQVIQDGLQAGYQRLLDELYAGYRTRITAPTPDSRAPLESAGSEPGLQ